MDTIFIDGLKVTTLIGVYAWERTHPQELQVDIEINTDLTLAAQTDQLTDTLDYAAIAQGVQALGASSQFDLLESLALAMIHKIFTFEQAPLRIESIKVCIHKLGLVPDTQSVGVRLMRERAQILAATRI